MEGENSNGSDGSKRKYADIGQCYATKQIKQRVDRSVDCILSCWQTLRPDQRLVFCARLLQDDRLFSFFEPVIGNPSEVIVMKSMIRNLKDGLQEVKSANSKDKLAAKHSLLSMIVGKKGDINKNVSSKLLKIQPRNLSKAAARRKIMSLSGANVWALAGRMPRSNRIDDSIKCQVREFWLDNTKVSPKVRDVMKRRTQAIQYLDISQSELYQQFVYQNPDTKIRLRQFEYLKPDCIRKLKERNTCCCVKHEQADLYRKAFNDMRRSLHVNCTCCCSVCASQQNNGVCQANKKTFDNVSTLWRSTVCEKYVTDEWHKLKCIKGECDECGVKKLDICPNEEDGIQNVDWKVYAYVNEPSKKGTSRRLRLVDQNDKASVLLKNMKNQLAKFTDHNFTAHWQSKQFKRCVEKLPDNSVLSVVDFAENYTLKPGTEVQSEHWNPDQISILVHISMMKIEGKLKKTVHFYVSDDRKHDTHFVQHGFKLHLDWLKNNGGGHINLHYVWSDGCASQFKSARAWYGICRYHVENKIRVIWNFFGSGHGKGTHDGEAGIAKLWLESEQRKQNGMPVTGAGTACAVLRAKESDCERVFWEVGKTDVNRQQAFNCKTLPGTQQIHSVSTINPADPTKLLCRPLSCFCDACMNFNWLNCENIKHCGEWSLKSLEPTDHIASRVEAENDVDVLYAEDEAGLDDTVAVSDVFVSFAAPDNVEGVSYYVLLCTREKHALEEDSIDDYGNEYSAGTSVIEGQYYELIPGCHNKYKLLPTKNVLVPAESVIGVRIPFNKVKHKLKGASTAFHLPDEVHETLLSQLPAIVDDMD